MSERVKMIQSFYSAFNEDTRLAGSRQGQLEYLTTVAADSILDLAGTRRDFAMSDEEFAAFAKYHLATCEKRELLGCSSHLLYICRKTPKNETQN